MDQQWIQILMILLLCRFTSAVKEITVKEGDNFPISCKSDGGSMIIWFRVLDGSVSEFIASFSSSGIVKSRGEKFSDKFTADPKAQTLTLKSFNKKDDSGIYICASLVGGNKLTFGEVTKLTGEKTEATPPPPIPTTKLTSTTALTLCPCKEKDKKTGWSMFCSPIILGALAGGCGLLLLLLIVTILYCNKIRTRRCPHHYKRKPRPDALEKQMMTNRYV